jgi:pimeloyl-ACP methyl ester carboxylesterase
MPEALPCLLLPGTLCDGRLFAPMQAAWQAQGLTLQTQVANLHTLETERSAWWHTQLQAMPERFHVLGFSLGGLLALELLARWPERVASLALLASNAAAGSAALHARTQQQRLQWQAQGAGAVGLGMLNAASPSPTHPAHAELVQAMAEQTPHSAFVAQGRLNATRPDGLQLLARSQTPLLLISGALDPWCGSDKQQAIRAVRPDAHWHALPRCGHYIPLEQPHIAADLCAPFFAGAHSPSFSTESHAL